MRMVRVAAAALAAAADMAVRFSFRTMAVPGAAPAAVLEADFPAAADLRVAAGPRGAGDGAHRRGPCRCRRRYRRGREKDQCSVRVRAGACIFRLRARPDHRGERLGAVDAMAAHPIHGAERAVDFFDAACRVHRVRADFFLDAAAAGSGSPRGSPRARASRGAGAIRPAPYRSHQNRTGVLIFVSLAERYARILADDGIAQKVHAADWQAAVDALIGHMQEGRIAAGYTAAIERCATVAAAHAPPDGSANEVPDRLY